MQRYSFFFIVQSFLQFILKKVHFFEYALLGVACKRGVLLFEEAFTEHKPSYCEAHIHAFVVRAVVVDEGAKRYVGELCRKGEVGNILEIVETFFAIVGCAVGVFIYFSVG